MKTLIVTCILFATGVLYADDYWTFGSPESHVNVQDIRKLEQINFPDEPIGTTPAEAAKVIQQHFREHFPKSEPPIVESVELRRFPEEYGKNRFFYVVHLRPLSAQSLDLQGNLLRTDKYQGLVPLPYTGTSYNCALPVIKSK